MRRLLARTRVAVPAVLLFSTLTLAITLVHADRFHFDSPTAITRASTLGWLIVYVSVPVAMSWLLVASNGGRDQSLPGSRPWPSGSGSCWPPRQRSCWVWARPYRDHRRPRRLGERLVAAAAH